MSARKQARAAMGPKTLVGSPDAKRQSAVLLEVLSGLLGAREGSRAMGVSLTRYYLLETRALQGMLQALEPRPRGRHLRPEDVRERLEQEKRRLEREVSRLQTLVRAAHRSLGIAPTGEGESKMGAHPEGKPRRKRKVPARAVRAIRVLRPGGATGSLIATGKPEAKPTGPPAS